MSNSNLLKGVFTNLQQDDRRVIDTNELVAKRIEELAIKMQRNADNGFSRGLNAQTVSMEGVIGADYSEGMNEMPGDVEESGEISQEALQGARQEAEMILESARQEAESIPEDAKMTSENEKNTILYKA